MPLRHLDLASLSLFRAVCASGSITHGAHDFGLAVGAASRRIAALERQLGSSLLVRSKGGAVPTPAGRQLLEHAERLSEEADRLDLSFDDFRLGIHTRVRIWANTSAVNGFLPERMVAFSRRHPEVRIDLDEVFSDAIVRGVADGQAEIGVFAETAPAWPLHTAVCDTHRLVAIAPRQHPLARRRRSSFEEVLEHDFIGLTRGTALQVHLAAQAQRQGKPLRLRMQVRSYDAICKIVSVGLGVSLVPEQVARLLGPPLQLAVIPLEDAWVERRLVAGVRSLDALSPAAMALYRMLTD